MIKGVDLNLIVRNLNGDWAKHNLLSKSSYLLAFWFDLGGQHLYKVVLVNYM